MVTHSNLSLSHICGLVSKWTFTLPLCGSSWCLFANHVIQIQEKDGVAPGKFHNYNLTRFRSLLQIKGAPECLINIASHSSLIFSREQSLLLQAVPTGTCGLTPSICRCSNCDAFLVLTWAEREKKGSQRLSLRKIQLLLHHLKQHDLLH